MGNDDTPRPGFDHWVALRGQGTSFDAPLNVNGQVEPTTGYVTDRLNEAALEFVRREHERPFLLYLSHKAIHPETAQRDDGSLSDPSASNFLPAPRHAKLYEDKKIERRPNALHPPHNKPALARKIDKLPPLSPDTGTDDDAIRGRLRMLAAVDEGVGQLLDALEKSGELDRTVFVVAGDNGYFYGEHGLSVERRLAYEESIRIPLLVRFPGLVKPGSTPDATVLNIDLAPTLLELADVKAPEDLDGHSLVPILAGRQPEWRDSFLIEYYTDTVFPRVLTMGYQAVRTNRWKYIHYMELAGMDELYDLQADPYELENRIDDPAAAETLKTMQTELKRLAAD